MASVTAIPATATFQYKPDVWDSRNFLDPNTLISDMNTHKESEHDFISSIVGQENVKNLNLLQTVETSFSKQKPIYAIYKENLTLYVEHLASLHEALKIKTSINKLHQKNISINPNALEEENIKLNAWYHVFVRVTEQLKIQVESFWTTAQEIAPKENRTSDEILKKELGKLNDNIKPKREIRALSIYADASATSNRMQELLKTATDNLAKFNRTVFSGGGEPLSGILGALPDKNWAIPSTDILIKKLNERLAKEEASAAKASPDPKITDKPQEGSTEALSPLSPSMPPLVDADPPKPPLPTTPRVPPPSSSSSSAASSGSSGSTRSNVSGSKPPKPEGTPPPVKKKESNSGPERT